MKQAKNNFIQASNCLSEILDDLTLWDITCLWCCEMLRRKRGNRVHSSKALGISHRTLTGHIGIIKDRGWAVTPFDPDSRNKPVRYRSVRR